MGLDQSGALALLLVDSCATFDVPQFHPGLDRKFFHHLGKAQVVYFLDEGQHIAALPAAEAVPHAAARGDMETGAALVVERA